MGIVSDGGGVIMRPVAMSSSPNERANVSICSLWVVPPQYNARASTKSLLDNAEWSGTSGQEPLRVEALQS